MTDRVKGLTVVLDKDYREDDVEALCNAIRMLRGVLSVTKEVTDLADYLSRERVRQELVAKLVTLLEPPAPGGR